MVIKNIDNESVNLQCIYEPLRENMTLTASKNNEEFILKSPFEFKTEADIDNFPIGTSLKDLIAISSCYAKQEEYTTYEIEFFNLSTENIYVCFFGKIYYIKKVFTKDDKTITLYCEISYKNSKRKFKKILISCLEELLLDYISFK
ncbi:UNVERIFIED_CONTAM: hypothetical protein O8I53_09215 [Campylobacter lari]